MRIGWRKRNEVPELNTTSTADISFMLLVFFLVTSSMDVDKGLGRKLAPLDDQQQEQQDVQRSNVLQVSIDEHDALFCDGRQVTPAELQRQVASFVASRQTAQHVIAVEADRHATYNTYFEMQNAIVAAYQGLRDQMARRQYGHAFSECSQEEREAVMARYPQRIREGVSEKGGQP